MVENREQLIQVANVIAAQFGENTEVVLHDFSEGLESTIIYIVNGHVTGRDIGGCPTKLFLQYYHLHKQGRSKMRYITHTPDGKILRSSTANFYNENGILKAALCINQDITDMVNLERDIKSLGDTGFFETSVLSNTGEDESESYPTSIQGLLEGIIAEGLAMTGTPPAKMNKEAKIKLLAFLDERGVFLIQKSGQRLCELLDISKFTLYNYLEEVRGK